MDTRRNNTGPIAPFYLFMRLFMCMLYPLHIFGVVCAHIKFSLVQPLIYRSVASVFSILCCVTNSEKLNIAENEKHEYCECVFPVLDEKHIKPEIT